MVWFDRQPHCPVESKPNKSFYYEGCKQLLVNSCLYLAAIHEPRLEGFRQRARRNGIPISVSLLPCISRQPLSAQLWLAPNAAHVSNSPAGTAPNPLPCAARYSCRHAFGNGRLACPALRRAPRCAFGHHNAAPRLPCRAPSAIRAHGVRRYFSSLPPPFMPPVRRPFGASDDSLAAVGYLDVLHCDYLTPAASHLVQRGHAVLETAH